MKDQIQLQAQLRDNAIADQHVGEIFIAAADKGFRSLDVFVTWFTAGTAAALGLAAANLERLEGLISLVTIKSAMPWLAGALMLVLFSKFLGSMVCTMSGAADESRRIRREAAAAKEPLPSPTSFQAAVERATPWPLFYLLGRAGLPGRRVMRILMWSGLSALLACACVVIFWGVLLKPALASDEPPLRNRVDQPKITGKNAPAPPSIAERK